MFLSILEKLTGSVAPQDEASDLRIAVAVLLLMTAQMDDHFDASERRVIESLLAKRFALSPKETQSLLVAAEERAQRANQIFPFTHFIVEHMDPAARVALIEMLWDVAYAHGRLDEDEDTLIRRIAGLIYVSDHDRAAARQRIRRKRGLGDREPLRNRE